MNTYKLTFVSDYGTEYQYELDADSAVEANKSVDGILAELQAEYPTKVFIHDSTRAV